MADSTPCCTCRCTEWLDRPLAEARRLVLRHFEEAYVRHCLDEARGNVSRAADHARVTLRYFRALKRDVSLRSDHADANDKR